MQLDDILINEAQLGNQLSICVAENRRNDFSILLAMLSQNALDFSEFALPKSDPSELYAQDQNLRVALGAGVEQTLAPEHIDFLIGIRNAEIVQGDSLEQFKLMNYLTPEPLAIRNDVTHIRTEIIDNCELAVRKRVKNKDIQLSHSPMNAARFYEQLKSPEIHNNLVLQQA
ncbi:VC2046/SO_2500 family protein [Pseudoalteromonas denitrificans]|uniref:Ribosomal S4P n=1 Tax=Pseudoalteromonas denitrificans DSM 6059 TaxID=1123010 RepID=A0A1I1KVT9_9GAMM|nr:VC2046/SO_2500 family protein [Pseudoalteromonas denitrificans]SFC64725.1 Ribosomal S4P [Pseudoalteromonas denitrificans DSM 6059]